jgi:hypothetical protein
MLASYLCAMPWCKMMLRTGVNAEGGLMNRFIASMACSLAISMGGCSLFMARESTYLLTAENLATQTDVRDHLGQPHRASALPNGEVLWVYEIRDLEPMSQSSWSTLGSWCDEYRLRFDRGGILRQWSHASYLHGGELMPATCDGRLGVQKPAL